MVKLVDLLNEAVERAFKEIQRRREEEAASAETDGNIQLTTPAIATMSAQAEAEAIGYSAIRYFDLKQNRLTNYKFSYDTMLDPKG